MIQFGKIGMIGEYYFQEGIFSVAGNDGRRCFRLDANSLKTIEKRIANTNEIAQLLGSARQEIRGRKP